MRLICDTNILLDVICRRDPFYTDSACVLNMCEDKDVEGLITVTSLSDLFYITRKLFSSKEKAYEALTLATRILKPCTVSDTDAMRAVNAGAKDFEDAMIAYTAEAHGCDYVITRNTADFEGLPVKAIEPSQLLELFMI